MAIICKKFWLLLFFSFYPNRFYNIIGVMIVVLTFFFFFSGIAWQLTLSRPRKQNRNGETLEQGKDIETKNGDLCILIFRPLLGSNNAVSPLFSHFKCKNFFPL